MQENNQEAKVSAKKLKKTKIKDENNIREDIKHNKKSKTASTSIQPSESIKTEKNVTMKEPEDLTEKKNFKRPKGKVVFDEELVTKYEAQNLIKEKDSLENNFDVSVTNKSQLVNKKKQKKKKRKIKELLDHPSPADEVVDNDETPTEIAPKKKKKHNVASHNEIEDIAEKQELDGDKPDGEKKQSLRAQKRAKHLKLLEEKKLKSELNMQQKCLNYLSQWKHDKSTWKFEKLKQVWLLQNLYDDAKVPNEFWDIAVKYFNSAKGKVKEVLLTEALKVIENAEKDDENGADVKYERARYLVQNLQE